VKYYHNLLFYNYKIMGNTGSKCKKNKELSVPAKTTIGVLVPLAVITIVFGIVAVSKKHINNNVK